MSLRDQIELAVAQQLEDGDYNLSEVVDYEPEDDPVIAAIRANVRRGLAKPEQAMGTDYDVFEAEVLIAEGDLGTVKPRPGDVIRAKDGDEVWRVTGIAAEVPGAFFLRAARKAARRALADV